VEQLDHRYLNEIAGPKIRAKTLRLDLGTAQNTTAFVDGSHVAETRTARCVFRGH
jgi:hypothetical protein